jgi:hypothetical protein
MITQPTLIYDTMNRLQKVTISGVVFHVEENCKRKLMDQIQLLHLEHDGLSDERLAELLLNRLREEETDVICAKMIEQVIEQTKHLKKPD